MEAKEAKEAKGTEKPWHQQPGESPILYGHFMEYLSMGSVDGRLNVQKKLADAAGLSPAYVNKIASTWRWRLRATDWLKERQKIELRLLERERLRWRKRRYEWLDRLDKILDAGYKSIEDKIDAGEEIEISISQFRHLFGVLLHETRDEFGDKKSGTQITIDQRAQTIEINTIEVVKDYGTPAIEGDVIEGEITDGS